VSQSSVAPQVAISTARFRTGDICGEVGATCGCGATSNSQIVASAAARSHVDTTKLCYRLLRKLGNHSEDKTKITWSISETLLCLQNAITNLCAKHVRPLFRQLTFFNRMTGTSLEKIYFIFHHKEKSVKTHLNN
jgi:hypothetical protein